MTTTESRSEAIARSAEQHIPGGVSSNQRRVDPTLVFTRAEGAYLIDADGKRYTDFHAAFGPLVLGHRHPQVLDAVSWSLDEIDLVGTGPTELESRLAAKLVEHIPSAERVKFCNSGSEATYHAIRLARAVTGRRRLIKFQGCYHGWHDAVAVNVSSPAEFLDRTHPLSAGMTPEVVSDTVVLPFNDVEQFRRTLQEQGERVAAVIVEPVAHNMGCILPQDGFLSALREETRRHGIVLIFDEVVTGFRHALGGYGSLAGITPDLTTLGKAIANGFPLAAVCGRAGLMDHYAPGGDVLFAGTYNGHPVGLAAALATIKVLERTESYPHLFALGRQMREGLAGIVARLNIEATVSGFGSVFVLYFLKGTVRSYADLLANDTRRCLAFRRGMIERGQYLLPVPLKRGHISLAHTTEDIDRALGAAEDVLRNALA